MVGSPCLKPTGTMEACLNADETGRGTPASPPESKTPPHGRCDMGLKTYSRGGGGQGSEVTLCWDMGQLAVSPASDMRIRTKCAIRETSHASSWKARRQVTVDGAV